MTFRQVSTSAVLPSNVVLCVCSRVCKSSAALFALICVCVCVAAASVELILFMHACVVCLVMFSSAVKVAAFSYLYIACCTRMAKTSHRNHCIACRWLPYKKQHNTRMGWDRNTSSGIGTGVRRDRSENLTANMFWLLTATGCVTVSMLVYWKLHLHLHPE